MLKQRALTATLWSGIDVFFRQGMQFVFSIVLARLLSPEEFGTIALLYLFIGIASAFVDSGFSTALIQKQDTTHTDESTVFWFNLLMGTLAAGGLWAAAPAIAAFYATPILAPLMGVMALNILFSALGSIHSTMLTKQLNFRTLMKVSGIATAISGTVAVGLAWQGYGVWALAAQTVVASALTSLLLWLFNSWRPAMVFSVASARQLFGFGGYMLASSLLDTAYNRLYTVLIGKYFGIRELGVYDRADSTKQMPVGVLTSVLSRVALPIFSAAASESAQLRRGVRIALRSIMLINVPMMLGLAAVAEPFLEVVFGRQWLPAAPIMQILCLGAVFWPLHVINLKVLIAQGHTNLFFRLEVVKKVLGIVLLALGTLGGVIGIAWSQVAFNVIAFGINAHYTQSHLGYGARDQFLDFGPVLAFSALMALTVRYIHGMSTMSPFLELMLLTVGGVSLFSAFCWFARLSALKDLLELLGDRLRIRSGALIKP